MYHMHKICLFYFALTGLAAFPLSGQVEQTPADRTEPTAYTPPHMLALGLKPCPQPPGTRYIPALLELPSLTLQAPLFTTSPREHYFCDPDTPSDRYGTPLLYVLDKDGWLQARYLASGQAFLLPQKGETYGYSSLRRFEIRARNARLGLWAPGAGDTPYIGAPTALQKGVRAGTFTLSKATVFAVEKQGTDWLLTLTNRGRIHVLATPDSFKHLPLKPADLWSRTIEVRGSLTRDTATGETQPFQKDDSAENTVKEPLIIITRPFQITLIE